MSTPAPVGLSAVFRAEHGRVVAGLARRLGDLDLAEDAVGEALVVAAERWPVDGVPPNPGAWLTTVARNKALDRLRREQRRDLKHAEAQMVSDPTPHEPTGPVADDRLRLVFTCCHPALAPEARVALTLRLLGGLTVPEIAAAYLVPETTMAQRLTRAKQKIARAGIPYRVPAASDLPERLDGVLAVLYLVFNEGYLSHSGQAVREDLTGEAIRLARQLHEMVRHTPSLGAQPEVDGLLALMLLTEARRPARVAEGRLVPLAEQDRTRWDAALVDEGHRLVRGCLALGRPGPYQLQAAVNAVHTDALDASMTDWSQVVQLYDQLLALRPTPVVALNRAAAVAEVDGPEVALGVVDRLPLERYHAWHATRADLLRRLGRHEEARTAYDAAIGLAGNDAERAFLAGRRDGLGRGPT
ncbi:RNA polymerase subunit sigma-24 [Marmoricola sp. Leaf446]|uniref:RNA polymerase sigma factor n=1 Tax=Marmoricola sp. Leaf446 TaxID=1736379 RepID=UPI0006FB3BD5|nr:sigma-70 family RNA polymerase sigma factor [Marmoricola sp. Leaf446]KQT89408.1 RNA polymerase subunit sigma-24 [Marmoricola sp. Leaf446]